MPTCRAATLQKGERRRLQRRGLIRQHDGDLVANGIAQFADETIERFLPLPVFQIAFTAGAHQDGEKLG
jgi:pantothenate kinase-related protein Tda10